MSQSIGTVLQRMETDCRSMVNKLNDAQEYRAATQVQGLLNQLANTVTGMNQQDPEGTIMAMEL